LGIDAIIMTVPAGCPAYPPLSREDDECCGGGMSRYRTYVQPVPGFLHLFSIKIINIISFNNITAGDCVMDTGAILSESVAYTRETFGGKWVRWLIFIILNLPMALFPFVFDMNRIMDKTTATIHWELVHWDQVALIVITGLLLSFFVSGYIVRIYRGAKPAPDFDHWGGLFLDGIRLVIVTLLWFLPILIVILGIIGIAFAAAASGSAGSTVLFIGLVLIGILIEIIICLVVILFSPIGAIRFARTGSITEGLRYSKVAELIGKIGWGQYIIALVVLFIVTFIFIILEIILALIPYAGWVFNLVMAPLLSVFIARYYTLIYEQGEEQPVTL
jgi:hypothetical protein